MRRALRRSIAAALALAGAGLAAAVAVAVAVAPGEAPTVAPPTQPGSEAQPPAAQISPYVAPLIHEGPAGRSRLARWTLRSDPADRGAALGWRRGGFAGRTVTVPNVVSSSFSGPAGARNYEGSVAWYRTGFEAPAAAAYALTFESANFAASVWVDGHLLGTHRGSYLPFEERTRLQAGAHTVVVRIDWRNPGAQSLAGFHRTWFNWGGLDGEVDVRQLGVSEVRPTALQTTLAPQADGATAASVKLSVRVLNLGASRTVTPEGALTRGAQRIALVFPALALEHGRSAVVSTTVQVPSPALWSPSSPSLYDLQVGVAGESSYSSRVGVRELGWHAGRMYLNGRRVTLRGATIQEDAQGRGDALGPGDEGAIVRELRAIGANAARAQHPLDPGLLERLDAAGILVWQGIGPVEGAGNWYSQTPKLLGEAETQARSAVAAAAIHPSVIAWNLVDEVADNGRDGAEVRYVQDLSRWLHAHDPSRPVAVDVWGDHPPSRPGALYAGADAIAETDYSGWYDSPRDTQAQLRAQMRRRLARMEQTFPGKVLLISEFGAESNTLNAPGSPGSYSYQSQLLAAHIAVYRSDPRLSGMLIWVLRDYPLTPTFEGGSIHGVLPNVRLIEGLNQKGLFTYSGQPKPAAGIVRRLFTALDSG